MKNTFIIKYICICTVQEFIYLCDICIPNVAIYLIVFKLYSDTPKLSHSFVKLSNSYLN